MSEHSEAELLCADVQEHGEAHAQFEEEDEHVEVRRGTAEFDWEHEVISIDAPSEPTERFSMESLVSWYLPEERRH